MEINDEDIVTPPPIFLYKNDEKTCSLLLDCDVIYSKSDNLIKVLCRRHWLNDLRR